MSVNYGKKFEERFKLDWKKSFPTGTITRLYDNTAGYLAISNICDFICYNYPNIFFIECKTHKGASLPLTNITQYEKLLSVADKPGVVAGVVLWLYEKDIVMFIPIQTLAKLKNNKIKSVGVFTNKDTYDIIIIPSKKLVRYMQCDYSVLQKGETK